MCGEEFSSNHEHYTSKVILFKYFCIQLFYSFKANYGGILGCLLRDEYFSGPFRTWKRWGEMYNERKWKPSTVEGSSDFRKCWSDSKKNKLVVIQNCTGFICNLLIFYNLFVYIYLKFLFLVFI